jgi:hypothetical protein
MATVVCVHGTFAHAAGVRDAPGGISELAWWEQGSSFEQHSRQLIQGQDGKLDFVSFAWDADNSEISRRAAASGLLSLLRGLEARGESYCLVGQSHGGSVISTALLESAARGALLQGLKKWITVATPFVRMKKEPFLFTRLALFQRVLIVASLMLFVMFLFYALAEFLGGGRPLTQARLLGFAFSGLMMSLPFFVFYGVLKYLDARTHYTYGRGPVRRARESYTGKWLNLCHEDDEAVQGLKLLPQVKLHLFEPDFAVSALTMASVLALPLLYLLIVTSPPLMVSIADLLKNNVYQVADYSKAEGPLAKERIELQRLARLLRMARRQEEKPGFDPATEEARRQEVVRLWKQVRELRATLHEKYATFAKVERAERFRRRFLEQDGRPCEGGALCGKGEDFGLNSALLFHVVTDELSSFVVDDGLQLGAFASPLRLIVPIVLVPVAFGLLALAMLGLIQVAARYISRAASVVLNRLTLAEIKRSAFGNDTEGEVALDAEQRPSWIQVAFPNLPPELGDRICDYSNEKSFHSLAKFRNAISTLAFAQGEESKASLISSYLSWKELIHTAYFDVPEFRELLALVLSRADGFAPTEAFKRHAGYERASRWLAGLEPQRVT